MQQDFCNGRQLVCVGGGGQHLLFFVLSGDFFLFFAAIGRVLQRFRKGSYYIVPSMVPSVRCGWELADYEHKPPNPIHALVEGVLYLFFVIHLYPSHAMVEGALHLFWCTSVPESCYGRGVFLLHLNTRVMLL